jgi:hypothetical protein
MPYIRIETPTSVVGIPHHLASVLDFSTSEPRLDHEYLRRIVMQNSFKLLQVKFVGISQPTKPIYLMCDRETVGILLSMLSEMEQHDVFAMVYNSKILDPCQSINTLDMFPETTVWCVVRNRLYKYYFFINHIDGTIVKHPTNCETIRDLSNELGLLPKQRLMIERQWQHTQKLLSSIPPRTMLWIVYQKNGACIPRC